MIKLFFILTLLSTFLFSNTTLTPIALSAEERQWLQSNPNIKLSLVGNQEPITIVKNGVVEGIIADYFKIINQLIGQKIELVPYPNAHAMVNIAKEKELYGSATLFKNTILEEFFDFTQPYMDTTFSFFVHKDSLHTIKNKDDLIGKRVAILKNNIKLKHYAQSIKDINITYVNLVKEQFEMLQYNRVDAIIGYINYHYLLNKMLLDNVHFAFSSKKFFGVRMGIKKEHKVLTAILNRSIAQLSESQKQAILAKWIKLPKEPSLTHLTPQEKAWLQQKHNVRVRVSNWPPFQMYRNNHFEGISVEYIERIFKKYNINYTFVPSANTPWKRALEMLRDKEGIDLLLTAHNTPQRQKDMLFTHNYISSPWVIFTRHNYSFVSQVNDLYGKRVAVQYGFYMHKLLKSKHPQINLKVIKGANLTQEALRSLAVGDVDAYIGNLATGSYIIKNMHFDNIKIAAPTKFGNHDNAMAIRKDWAPLVSIINKELKNISVSEKNRLYDKYLSITYEYGISFWDILKWVGIVIFVFASIVIAIGRSNRKLAKEIKQRKQLEEEVRKHLAMVETLSITDGLTSLYNRRHFDTIIAQELNRAKRNNSYLSFVMLDIDHFKKYNDNYGHQMGDETLKAIAQTLKKTLLRADDYCFRLGGEEFGILYIGLNPQESLAFANRFRSNIESLHIPHSGNLASSYVTASCGLFCAKAGQIEDVQTLYRDTDRLLYQAKESGRNRVCSNMV